MKIVAVYLTDAPADAPPIAAFPGVRSKEIELQIADFVQRHYPGRSYELRVEDVETVDPSKLQ